MSRFLLGWEFGAGRGHWERLRQIAAELVARGHDVHVAVQRIDAFTQAGVEGVKVWQAPLSPRLMAEYAQSYAHAPASMGDILARLGFDNADYIAGLLSGWDRLFEAIKPNAILGDFAPTMMLASRGRITAAAAGVGFTLPPTSCPEFPLLIDRDRQYAEPALLEHVNAGLKRARRTHRLDNLPQIFEAETQLVGEFEEIDPYRADRDVPVTIPSVGDPLPPLAEESGDEIFVYGLGQAKPDSQFWLALGDTGLPVRAYLPDTPPQFLKQLADRSFVIEPKPLPFQKIVERSRLVVSGGGHGTVCSTLLAGLPHIVCHHDIEKYRNGFAITELQLGGRVALEEIKRGAFAHSLKQIYGDDALVARCREAAPGFRLRVKRSMAEEAADALQALV